jgi:hypothetical protein
MPYLHWDTDRSRYKVEEIIRNVTEIQQKQEAQRDEKFMYISSAEVDEQNQEVRKQRPKLPKVVKSARLKTQSTQTSVELPDPGNYLPRLETPTEVVLARLHHEVITNPTSKVSKTRVAKALTRGGVAPKTLLGRVLYRAAMLSVAMDYYIEEQLLKEFLYSNPPYHPRRTLDQSSYWTIRSMKKRVSDHVVYRGTSPTKMFMHEFHAKTNDHDPPCRQCLDDIRKVPKVIMVDQLWLWILDGSKSGFFLFTSLLQISRLYRGSSPPIYGNAQPKCIEHMRFTLIFFLLNTT